MPNEKSQLAEFFKKSEGEFKLPTAPVSEQPSEQEELPEELKNRHIRKMEARNQQMKDEIKQMASRIEALSEAQKLKEEVGEKEWEKTASRIYGNEKPENAAATDLLLNSLRGIKNEAKEEAIREMRAEFQRQQQEEAKESQTLDSYIEQIEEQYGVDLTSTEAAQEKQKEYFKLLAKLSPKDANGEVREFADPFEVYELFASRQPQSRAKEVASRSMTNSRTIDKGVQEDATFKFLKEQGLLEPFS